jgi:hypothetical protein
MYRRPALAAALVATTLFVAACGSDSDDAASTPTAASTTAVPAANATITVGGATSTSTAAAAATTTAAPSSAGGAVSPSDTAQMSASMAKLVDRKATSAQMASEVPDGKDLGPAFDELLGILNEGDGFDVQLNLQDDVAITGDDATGSVEIVSNGNKFPDLYPAFFSKVDGTWHINRNGACSLMSSTGISCPEA